MRVKNFPGYVKFRREGALDRLKNPSQKLKKRISKFASETLKVYNKRVAREIATLQKRIGAVA